MSEFDRKHGINVRKKRKYLATMLFAVSVGMASGFPFVIWYPLPFVRKIHSWADALHGLPGTIFIISAVVGMTTICLFLAYTFLSWLDRRHAVAALRDLLLKEGDLFHE